MIKGADLGHIGANPVVGFSLNRLFRCQEHHSKSRKRGYCQYRSLIVRRTLYRSPQFAIVPIAHPLLQPEISKKQGTPAKYRYSIFKKWTNATQLTGATHNAPLRPLRFVPSRSISQYAKSLRLPQHGTWTVDLSQHPAITRPPLFWHTTC
jgi:hypothetical protein